MLYQEQSSSQGDASLGGEYILAFNIKCLKDVIIPNRSGEVVPLRMQNRLGAVFQLWGIDEPQALGASVYPFSH